MTQSPPLTPPRTDLLDWLCRVVLDQLDADAVVVEARDGSKVLARAQRRPLVHPRLEHREPLPGPDGVPESTVRVMWAVRRRLRHRQRRQLASLVQSVPLTPVGTSMRDAGYERTFRLVPVALWEEDLRELAAWVDELRAAGVEDFAAFLREDPDRIAVALRKIRILDVNPEALRAFTGQHARLVDSVIPEWTVRDANVSAWGEILQAVAERRPRVRVEIASTGLEGARTWSILEFATEQTPSGPDYGRVVVSATDITARKEAEADLELARVLLNTVHSAVMATDANGRIIYWNRRAAELYGWSRAEATGRPVLDLVVPPEQRSRAAEILSSLSETGSWEGEFTVRRKDGSTFPALVTDAVVRDLHTGVVGTVGVSTDLTRLKAAEERERSQADLARAVLDSVGFPSAVLDADGVIVAVNAAWRCFAMDNHADPERVSEGVSYLEVCRRAADGGEPDGQRALEGIQAVLAGESGRFEMEYVFDTGDRRRWFQLEAVPLTGREGAVVTHWDVTTDHQAREQLARSMEERQRFISSISHQLRTPLTGVVGFAELLKEGDAGLEAAERSEMIDALYRQSLEVAALVHDLVVAARADGGPVTVDPRPIDLLTEVERVASSLPDPEREVVVPDETRSAIADPLRLRQILRNLIANALTYGGPTVGVDLEDGDRGEVIVVVWDDGPPIEGDLQETMFAPFTNGNGEHPTSPGGVGLGLSVSRRLAELMGGALAYRHDGCRSRFELTLPAAQD